MANQSNLTVMGSVEPIPTERSEIAALIHIIDRAARDPSVDIDKLQRLMDMQERIMERNAKSAFASALSEMQPELPVIVERGKIQIGTGKAQMYALWEDINDAIKPVLAKNGFALSFRTGQQDGKIIVTGILSHREGHSEETTMHLPVDTSGSKNAVQAVGSSTSYGKRYTASALLNLTSRGEDDDGKAAADAGSITPEQAKELTAKCKEVAEGFDESFCNYFGIDTIADLPAKEYQRALVAIGKKKGAAK